jgi:hypothetical protein
MTIKKFALGLNSAKWWLVMATMLAAVLVALLQPKTDRGIAHETVRIDLKESQRVPLITLTSKHGTFLGYAVTTYLDGQTKRKFLLDSGSNALALDELAAKGLAQETGAEVHVAKVRQTAEGQYCVGEEFQLGPLIVKHPTYTVSNFKDDFKNSTIEITGICGGTLFRNTAVELNGTNTSLKFLSDGDLDAIPQEKWTPVAMEHGLPIIQCSFEGHLGRFLVDTGFNGDVEVNEPTWKKYRPLGKLDKDDRYVVDSTGKVIDEHWGYMNDFVLGTIRLSRVRTGFISDPKVNADLNVAGSVGIGLLRRFRVIFDLPDKRIAFL